MPSSPQATTLGLPAGKNATEPIKGLRIAPRAPVLSDAPQVIIPARLRSSFSFAPDERTRYVTVVASTDHIRWGSVLAGSLAFVVAYVGLLLLGLAIAVSVFEPFGDTITTNVSHYGPTAMIWSGGSIILSLFLGGFVAVRGAGIDTKDTAWLSGMMVFLSSLVLFVGVAGIGIGLFFKVLGADPVNVYIFGYSAIHDPGVPGPFVDSAKPLLWEALVSLLTGFVASACGGLAGCRKEKKTHVSDEEIRE